MCTACSLERGSSGDTYMSRGRSLSTDGNKKLSQHSLVPAVSTEYLGCLDVDRELRFVEHQSGFGQQNRMMGVAVPVRTLMAVPSVRSGWI